MDKGLRKLIRRFDEIAEGREPPPRIYLLGAGSLVLEGLVRRSTSDLDFICDEEGKLFENQVLPGGIHSHRVRSGLVCMSRGWRERSREALEFDARHVRLFIPDIHDRVLDKVARGLATDWQDVEAVLDARPSGFRGETLTDRARSLLACPTSSVFDAAEFREGFLRLVQMAGKRELSVPPLLDRDETANSDPR
jgi:hypothetical protein